jgi:hypothetical protein
MVPRKFRFTLFHNRTVFHRRVGVKCYLSRAWNVVCLDRSANLVVLSGILAAVLDLGTRALGKSESSLKSRPTDIRSDSKGPTATVAISYDRACR